MSCTASHYVVVEDLDAAVFDHFNCQIPTEEANTAALGYFVRHLAINNYRGAAFEQLIHGLTIIDQNTNALRNFAHALSPKAFSALNAAALHHYSQNFPTGRYSTKDLNNIALEYYIRLLATKALDALNASALKDYVRVPVTQKMIRFLAEAAQNVVGCDGSSEKSTGLSSWSVPVGCDETAVPSVEAFITRLVTCSNVQVPTLMSSLVYLNRLRGKLSSLDSTLRFPAHSVFLGALIITAKYLNDSSPRNKYWAAYSDLRPDNYDFFLSRGEVNRVEVKLLGLLNWDLHIDPEDLYTELNTFLQPFRQSTSETLIVSHMSKPRPETEARRAARKAEKELAAAAYRKATAAHVVLAHRPAVAAINHTKAPTVTVAASSVSWDSPPALSTSCGPSPATSSRATTPSGGDEDADVAIYTEAKETRQTSYYPRSSRARRRACFENATLGPVDKSVKDKGSPGLSKMKAYFKSMSGRGSAATL